MIKIHKILIMGRNQAISHSYHKDIDECIIISINDPEYKVANFDRQNPKVRHVLKLFFNDIDHESERGTLMSKDDAIKIKQFIDTWKDKVNTIIVHCFAGVSRSAGVACAISRYLNGDDVNIWGQGSYAPNLHCYKLTCNEFGINVTTEEIKHRTDLNWNAFEIWDNANDNAISKMFVNNKLYNNIKENN